MENFSKIPPPVVVLILVISTFFSSKKIDLILIPFQTLLSIFILSVGILILINPVLKFKKSKTTINPIKFKKVNRLVTSGIYKYTRNPMYVGMNSFLLGLILVLKNPLNIFFLIIFFFVVRNMFVLKEEVQMEETFGEDYLTYKRKVRRWL